MLMLMCSHDDILFYTYNGMLMLEVHVIAITVIMSQQTQKKQQAVIFVLRANNLSS